MIVLRIFVSKITTIFPNCATRLYMKNLSSIDYAKLFFAFCIIFIHTDILGGNSNYIGYVTCQGLLRIAVPFFFITSGYFYFSVMQKNKIKKWFSHNIKTYALWTLLYLPIILGLVGFIRAGKPLATDLTYLSLNAVFGFWHLWFFPALIVSALLTLLLAKLKDRTSIIICCILYTCGTLLQYRANYAIDINRDIWSLATVFFSRNGLFMGFPLFMLGYLINKNNIRNNNTYLLIGSIILVIIEASVNYSYGTYTFDMLFSLPFAGVFVFLKVLDITLKTKNTFTIREHSKNIYLIQIYAIQFAKQFASDWLVITTVACTICISYSIANIIKDNLIANFRLKSLSN